jgi:hypothetical protein
LHEQDKVPNKPCAKTAKKVPSNDSNQATHARYRVPKMVKKGGYSSFVYWRLIRSCFDEQLLAALKNGNSWIPTNSEGKQSFSINL